MNNELKDKPIKNISINIGQASMGGVPWGVPYGDVFINFVINDRCSTLQLKDLKNWIDEIYESNGNRNEKAYEAYRNLKSFFHELLSPFIDYNLIK